MNQVNTQDSPEKSIEDLEGRTNSSLGSKFRDKLDAAKRTPLPSGKWVTVLAIASFIALASSGYLTYVALTSSKIAGCGGGRLFNCGHVISSRWSLWLGIPVSLLAVGLYLALASSLFVGASKTFSSSLRHVAWAFTSVLAIAAGLSAIWFISLQVFVLNHLCTYCLVAHFCGLVAASAVLWLKPIGLAGMKTISMASFAGFIVLVGGQLLTEPPKTYRIEQHEAPASESDVEIFEFEAPVAPATDSSAAPQVLSDLLSASHVKNGITSLLVPVAALKLQVTSSADGAATQQAAGQTKNGGKAASRRMVAINGGAIHLDVAQWPVAGSTSAKYIFVEMFDYSCLHCRQTYAAIKSAKETLAGDMAVVVLPVPLNAACNGTIQVTDPVFDESCEISTLAVAVWRVDPAKFTDFHNWMFVNDEAPTYAIAKAHAETLVDAEKLNTEIASGVPTQYLAKTVELYKRAGSGNIPKLIFPTTSIVGEFTSSEGLVEVIKQQIK